MRSTSVPSRIWTKHITYSGVHPGFLCAVTLSCFPHALILMSTDWFLARRQISGHQGLTRSCQPEFPCHYASRHAGYGLITAHIATLHWGARLLCGEGEDVRRQIRAHDNNWWMLYSIIHHHHHYHHHHRHHHHHHHHHHQFKGPGPRYSLVKFGDNLSSRNWDMAQNIDIQFKVW